MLGKEDLLAAIASTNRGILASSEQQSVIQAAATRLEEQNPNPSPTASGDLLDGDWRLLYTTSTELLGIDRFPLLDLGQIYQCIRLEGSRVYNIAETQSPLGLNGLVSVVAKFDVASERRLNVSFERAVFGLQSLAGYSNPSAWIEILDSGKRLPAVDIKIQPRERPGWIDVTYLDQELRINRGNAGSLFVLQRA